MVQDRIGRRVNRRAWRGLEGALQNGFSCFVY